MSNKLKLYYDETCRIRGLIIDETSKLEKQMDDFICQSLVGRFEKKISLMKELFIENEVMYSKKVKIVTGLLKNKHSEAAYNKYYKSLNENLTKIATIRNGLAHGCTVLPKKLDFGKYKISVDHKKDGVHMTQDEVGEHLKLIKKTKLIFVSHFNRKRLK